MRTTQDTLDELADMRAYAKELEARDHSYSRRWHRREMQGRVYIGLDRRWEPGAKPDLRVAVIA